MRPQPSRTQVRPTPDVHANRTKHRELRRQPPPVPSVATFEVAAQEVVPWRSARPCFRHFKRGDMHFPSAEALTQGYTGVTGATKVGSIVKRQANISTRSGGI